MQQTPFSLTGASHEQRRPAVIRSSVRWGKFSTALVFLLVSFASTLSPAQQNTASPAQLNSASGTQVPAQPGTRVQLEGDLEIMYQDFKDRAQLSYALKMSNSTRVPLKFVKNPPTHLLTGAHVQVDGELSGGSVILYSGSANVKQTGGGGSSPTCTADSGTSCSSTSSIPVPNTFGPQSTLLILINFQDSTLTSCDPAATWNTFSTNVNSFFAENSYGQTSFTGAAVGCYTIPESVTTCNTSQIATDAQNAATAKGVNLSSYSRYVYLFPEDGACGFGGASTVGGNPSQSWLNGTLDPDVVNHELGHALGLFHSHSLDCGTTATICSSGTVQEYGDQMDVMGSVQTASPDYNAFQKERLGWLNYGTSPSIQTVTASGTYTINPYENGTGPNALKVLQSTDSTTGAKTWYYLESRQAIGFDAFLTTWPYSSTQNATTGVLFHLGTDGNGNSSLMLNMAPATPTYDFEMFLPVSQSFRDSTAGVTFTPTAVNSTGATVQITMNGASCTAANPTLAVSPSQSQSVTAGAAVNFTVSVKNNDSSACAPATFNLGDVLPSGWTGLWSTVALSLSPGKSASATLSVTSPVATSAGSYNVGVSSANASAPSYSGSATATYVVSTSGSFTVSVATNQSSYQPGQTVSISVTMMSGTSAAAGANVTVTVTPPGGKATTLSGTTGSNGVALLNYKLSKRATAGTYGVKAATAATGATATVGASTSFSVQ